MKSYEEMTEAVLSRANAQRAAQRCRHKNGITVIACACFLGFAVWAATALARPTKSDDPRISVFYVTANASAQQQMLEGEKVPYYAVISVRDITGAGAVELTEIKREELEYARQLADRNPDDPVPTWSRTVRTTETTMITTIFAGSFYLAVDDYEQIQDVSVATTEIGFVTQHGVDYYETSKKDGIGITWSLSEAGVEMIEENPQMQLSELADTLTVTVKFKDGSTEVAVIDITVDDDGQIYGTFQGTN